MANLYMMATPHRDFFCNGQPTSHLENPLVMTTAYKDSIYNGHPT